MRARAGARGASTTAARRARPARGGATWLAAGRGGHAGGVQRRVRRGRQARRPLRAARARRRSSWRRRRPRWRRRIHLRRAAAPREPARRLAPARRAERVSRHAQQQLRQGRPRGVLLQRRDAEGRVPRQRHRDGRAVARAGRLRRPTRSTSRPPAPRARRPTRSTAPSGCCCTAAACPRCRARSTAWTRRRAQFPVAAFKTYTQFGPGDGAAGFFLDDDHFGTPFIERARKLGVKQHRRAQGPAVRPARLRVLDLARHRPGGQAPPGHDLPDLPLRLRHRA